MAIYYNNENKYAECCKSYRIIWETLKTTKKIVPETLDFNFSANISDVLSNYIAFLSLQPYSEVNHKELQSLSEKEELEKYPEFLHLIKSLLSEEVVSCNVHDYNTNSFELFRDTFVNSKVTISLFSTIFRNSKECWSNTIFVSLANTMVSSPFKGSASS